MATFGVDGLEDEDRLVIPAEKVIEAGRGPGALEVIPKPIYESPFYKWITNYLGWIVRAPAYEKPKEHKPPPAPPGGGTAGGKYTTSEDSGEYPLSKYYDNLIKRMLRQTSRYPVVLRDSDEMLVERDSTGYETGNSREIEIGDLAGGMPSGDFADRYFHEEAALDILGKNRYPGDHDERHDEIIEEGERRARRFKDYLSAMMN